LTNPYSDLPDSQFWRRAVSVVEPHLIDPIVGPKFKITRQDRVATAGSCFAQHLSKNLAAIGFNYFVAETGSHLSVDDRRRRNFSVFSARYGNIYTVRQALQLFREAFGSYARQECVWQRDDGRYVDAFRPTVEPEGYESPQDVLAAREEHLDHVRRVFLESQIFVLTLGMTEGWIHRSGGDLYPLAPGVAAGRFHPQIHEFVNFRVDEVIADLNTLLTELKRVNPDVRVLLTVSPVPLAATFEPRHVLVSTAFSKSVLRVAAGVAADRYAWVDYFPAYEIITGNFNMGRYFDEDRRGIQAAGVRHVMRCFLKHYLDQPEKELQILPLRAPSQAELAAWDSLICDEELIDGANGAAAPP
jgi:hypothetical protein